MFLKNQQTKNPTNLNDVIQMVNKSGMTPEQFVKQLLSSGKITQQDLDRAIDFANKNINRR